MRSFDIITILRHPSCLMAKIWQADGKIKSYDNAKYFGLHERSVNSIREFTCLLNELERDPHSCIIRGKHVGNEKAEQNDPEYKPGKTRRISEVFDDQPLHTILIEIDDFMPTAGSPVSDPVPCINEFIRVKLPSCFHCVSYHYQLSNSAGHPDKKHLLKAHVWFWLKTPFTSAQLKAWAEAKNIECDHSVFNAVQIHYTASPVFMDGIIDPVPVRSGFVDNILSDVVDLDITGIPEAGTGNNASNDKETRQKKTKNAGINDPIGVFLAKNSYVKSVGSDGRLNITCPFEEEHTSDSTESSTVYFPAHTGGYACGAFKCQHAHCSDRKRHEFLEKIDYVVDEFNIFSDNSNTPPALNPKDHSGIAHKLLSTQYHTQDGVSLLRSCGQWYEHQGIYYKERTEEGIRAATRKYLDHAVKMDNNGVPVPFQPSVAQLNGVLDALRSAALHENMRPPVWLKGHTGIDPRDCVSMENGILHIPSRNLFPHSVNFFTVNALPYPWVDSGRPIEMIKFIEQVWPADAGSQNTFQEILGYLLTPDTRQQKIFLLKGPKRSGKGTIQHVIKGLLGQDNLCGPSLTSLAGQFGLQSLIGKLVAIVPDARVSGRSDKQVIVERLLMISGEDNVTIDRKHIDAWTGILPTRIILLTNETPQLGDAAGALASRFIVLAMERSFYGKEDLKLRERLQAELPQIFCWALEGRDRLAARGCFIQPKAAQHIVEELEQLNSPISAFIEEKCELGVEFTVDKGDIFNAWCNWCRENGRQQPGVKDRFCASLLDAVTSVKSTRPREGDVRRQVFMGIRIKSEFESPAAMRSGWSG